MKKYQIKYIVAIISFLFLPFMIYAGGGDQSDSNPTGGFGSGEYGSSSSFGSNPKGGFGDDNFEVMAPPPPPDDPEDIPLNDGVVLLIIAGLLIGGKKLKNQFDKSELERVS